MRPIVSALSLLPMLLHFIIEAALMQVIALLLVGRSSQKECAPADVLPTRAANRTLSFWRAAGFPCEAYHMSCGRLRGG